ncbi:MAG: DUF5362 domain-containing protein [Ignavibacteriaceae bacterium]|mgnify:FL=1|jgi:hypothetical protein|nr:DUF5362 domain-containing protein [Ignavibacteriaceae bacterium]
MDDFTDINLDTDNQPNSNTSFRPPSMFQITFNEMTKDMRFVGIFIIIYGALQCLSIIGAIVGIPLILIGLRMREAADQFDNFKLTNNAHAMRLGFELQAKYFRLSKIIIIISLVIMVLMIILFFAILIPLFTSVYQMQGFNQYG